MLDANNIFLELKVAIAEDLKKTFAYSKFQIS